MADSSSLQLITAAQIFQECQRGVLILDTRPAERFAAFHIRGSIQISLMGHFASWAAILIDPRLTLLLIADDAKSAHEAYDRLTRVAFRQVIGYSLADENQWRKEGLDLASISLERCEEIRWTLQSNWAFQLVDVRSRAEWLQGHLPGAISLPLLDFEANRRIIDLSKPSLVYCHEGYRATTAASILLRHSAGKIGILIDGVEGWSALGLPLEMPNIATSDHATCPPRL